MIEASPLVGEASYCFIVFIRSFVTFVMKRFLEKGRSKLEDYVSRSGMGDEAGEHAPGRDPEAGIGPGGGAGHAQWASGTDN